jgi:hypothetical protein
VRAHEDQTSLPSPSRQSGGTHTYWTGGDRKPNWRQSSLALVVPARVYRQHVGDGGALTAARVWEDFAFAEQARDSKGPVSRSASPESLADDLSGKWPAKPSPLPLCAASAETLRMPDDGPARSAFHPTTTLVTVPVTVTDAEGHAVLDAHPSDLHVFEDGVEQTIDRVLPVDAPSKVALLLNTSASMRLKADDLRSNDRLDRAYRKIRVTIDRPGHTVRARQGFGAPASRT